MIQSNWAYRIGILSVMSLGGILGGLNVLWARQTVYPVYGLVIDLILIGVAVLILVNLKRWRTQTQDEFAMAKKRLATQVGFVTGFALFALSNVLPFFIPDAWHAFIASLDGANEGFIIGRVFGMAPFLIGLLVGLVYSWLRYR